MLSTYDTANWHTNSFIKSSCHPYWSCLALFIITSWLNLLPNGWPEYLLIGFNYNGLIRISMQYAVSTKQICGDTTVIGATFTLISLSISITDCQVDEYFWHLVSHHTTNFIDILTCNCFKLQMWWIIY